ncbi:deoxyribodipyrimidine photo-lyase [Sediminibacterium sp.]|uniref:cryptochrome/photolyase family protein n=1 Tax=Sediminibacterium sp. TaxID=1917865 RepID=UPI00273239F2|nr:deoxyribodipyrimidine photo-lyase [Sediminibacterium sp.]MDP3392509.1 deoxyribodipyrimidine photo-lyase [Sediminibacterium sp.]MDP3565775.1 deoxyribodipyrimidine photo-lyase [Sediminibacterium sp.]
MKPSVNIIWFRRDLRLKDNAALYHALQSGVPVLPIFIFDTTILDQLPDRADKRVAFIHAAIAEMQTELVALGSTLQVFHGKPLEVFTQLVQSYHVQTVFTNHDYEPYAQERDNAIADLLTHAGVGFETYKDQVIFEKEEVTKDDGKPYTVFTPYSRKWKAKLTPDFLKPYPTEKYVDAFYKQAPIAIPSLASMNFKEVNMEFPSKQLNEEIVRKYSQNRDFPALENGTSKMGVHLRFGTVSIRALATIAAGLNETYLNELIWREFYQMILWHFPKVGKGHAFKAEYEKIKWRNNEEEFQKWCDGKTGYPIVDAGMRELNATGFMHNRVRMIVASFLTKHLLIDWRWGEAYFANKLLDFDLSANNGGWQWAASSGCDAAPYFRVFNPYLQTEKFDKELKYIKKWVPEFQEFNYPQPIVVHEVARKRVLETYAAALKPV